MNIFVPQSMQASIELQELADVRTQLIKATTSTPIYGVIQDTLIGAYNMTSINDDIHWRDYMNLVACIDFDELHRVEKNKTYNGHDLFSEIIPKNINYYKKQGDKVVVDIKNSKIIEGSIGRDLLVSGKNGLSRFIMDEYNELIAGDFITNAQRLCCFFNMYYGFSVGIGDTYITDNVSIKKKDYIKNKITLIQKMITELENNPNLMRNDLCENIIKNEFDTILGDVGEFIINDIKPDNKMNSINIGVTGNKIHMSQISGTLGQVTIEGERVKKMVHNRPLPHFFQDDDTGEARGLVKRSFLEGFSWEEFVYHHMASREGLIDSAIKSVTPDTPIVIIENDDIQQISIGEWIDKKLELHKKLVEHHKDRDMELLKLDSNSYISTCNESGNVTWGKITAVTRHDPGLELYEIKTHSGRQVIVTESKSLLIWCPKQKKFLHTSTPEVKIGDHVPITMKLAQPPIIKEYVDMIEYFPKTEYMYGSDFVKEKHKIEKHSFVLTKTNTSNIKNGYIYSFHENRTYCFIPDKFQLNKENGIFIGLFLANGNVDIKHGYVQITNDDINIQNFVKKWFRNNNIICLNQVKINNICKTTCVQGRSTLLANFLTKFVGHNTEHKYVPNEAFVAPYEFIIGLLNGYISGNGTITNNSIVSGLASKKLIEGICMLCSRLNIFGKITNTKINSKNPNGVNPFSTYSVSIRCQWAQIFANKITLIDTNKNIRLQKIKTVSIHKNFKEQEDVVLDKIIEINKIDVKKYPKVYDLTVPSTLNFGLANGLHVVDTAESGYVQRKLIKSMEDVIVRYDNTVRTSTGAIYQFVYGDNGINTTKQFVYNFGLLLMNNEKIKEKFCFKNKQQTKLYDDNIFLEKIIRIRNMFRATLQKTRFTYVTFDTQVFIPVNIILIVNNAKNNNATNNNIKNTKLTIDHVMTKIKEILNPLNTSVFTIKKSNVDDKNNLQVKDDKLSKKLFKAILYENLAPKRVIEEYSFSKEQFDGVCELIITGFKKARVESGEMIGIIAAQSMGEPTTQMTLKAFHFSGISAMGTTNLGVGRMKELMGYSKNIKTPKMFIYLMPELMNDINIANKIANHLKFTTIYDVRKSVSVYYDPEPDSPGGFMEQDDIKNVFHNINTGKSKNTINYNKLPWLLRIKFDREKMFRKDITLLDIKTKMCNEWEKKYQDIKYLKREEKNIFDKIINVSVLSNSDNSLEPTMHIRIDVTTVNITLLNKLLDEIIDNFKIKGISEINDVNINVDERLVSFDENTGDVVNKTNHVLYTSGVNMIDIRNIFGIDLTKTYCNDIAIVYEIYGIEAARNVLRKEFNSLFMAAGNSVNNQHISLLLDTMTNSGVITAIDRNGMNKLDFEPLPSASFEKPVERFNNAAVYGETDTMRSVSARIMAGMVIKGGTGLCNLIIDSEMIEKSEFVIDDSNVTSIEETGIIDNVMTKKTKTFIPV